MTGTQTDRQRRTDVSRPVVSVTGGRGGGCLAGLRLQAAGLVCNCVNVIIHDKRISKSHRRGSEREENI